MSTQRDMKGKYLWIKRDCSTSIKNNVPIFFTIKKKNSRQKQSRFLSFHAWLKDLIDVFLLFPPSRPTETVCEYEVQFHQRLDQERAQWNQYREAVERELGDLRRRLTEGQEEENLEDEMKKVGSIFCILCIVQKYFTEIREILKYRNWLFSHISNRNQELTKQLRQGHGVRTWKMYFVCHCVFKE